ncbi:MAG: EVE domain-containing protein [Bryobacteraceae bacterium]|nr:EVE domain-containing protein [Bryobacteraceae bacterium]
MANYFLAKTEPSVYSIDNLQKDKRTKWDGVKNPQALQAIRSMTPGDRVFIYHSGGVSSIVGLAEVSSAPTPDPADPKLTVVGISYVCHLDPPTSLAEIKGCQLFSDWSLVRQSRLSTMAAPEPFVDWMRGRYPDSKI